MRNKEKLSDHYKQFGYEITDEPDFRKDEFEITPEIERHIEDLYFEAHDPKKGTIEKLINLIQRYPDVPQFKNYLTSAYMFLGNKKKAYESNNWTLKEHPDYLFAKINLAAQYIEQKE